MAESFRYGDYGGIWRSDDSYGDPIEIPGFHPKWVTDLLVTGVAGEPAMTEKKNPYTERVDHVRDLQIAAVEKSKLFTHYHGEPACTNCGAGGSKIMVTWTQDQTWGGGMFRESRIECRNCELREVIEENEFGARKHSTTWADSRANPTLTCVCGQTMASTKMRRVRHETMDGARITLERCPSCVDKPMCPAALDGEHPRIVTLGAEDYDPSKIRMGPLPEGLSGVGYCEGCLTPMIYGFLQREWWPMRWADVATIWEKL